MSDYSRIYDFSAKDALATGNPSKLIKGSEVDDEFDSLVTHVATKYDSGNLASQVQAEAETLNTVLMTPLRVANWADANAGIVGDLQALADPGADRLFGWDESANAAIAFSAGTGLDLSGTQLVLSHLGFQSLTDPGADRIAFWDDSAGAFEWLSLGSTLSISTTTLNVNEGSGNGLDADTLDGVEGSGYAQLSASNDFTNAGTRDSSAIVLTSANPSLAFLETGGSANEGGWDILADAGVLNFRTFTDAGGAGSTWLTVSRSGTSPSIINFPNGTLQYGGIEVGFRGLPQVVDSNDYTAVASDAGKYLHYSGTGGHTFTIPANASVSYAIGTVLTFVHAGSGGNLTIAITSDTLRLAGTSTTGSRTLAQYGMATALKVSSTTWIISGTGLS